MGFNAEADFKALRTRVEALERKLETIEKSIRALPDTAMLAKLVSRMDAAEKAIALKKDAKTAEQEANKATAKLVADIEAKTQAQMKELANKSVLDARLKMLETQVQTALAMAGAKR